MNLLAFLLVGGIIGWIAGIVMRTDTQQGVILNILAGIIGSGLGGTVILFALWNLLNKGRVR